MKFISVIKPVKSNLTDKKSNFIYFKHSILIFSWLKSLNLIFKISSKVGVSYLPKKSYKFSYSKAPMAHKTNSHERYSMDLFSFRASFYLTNTFYLDFDHEILSLLLFINRFPITYGTNLLQLKTLNLWCGFKSNKLFSYKNLYDEIGRHARLKTLSERVLVQVQI